jgi:DNA-binding NtrC family response regulator
VVVVVTGHSGINIAVAAMKAGASDFVMKPWSNARLLDTVRDAVALSRQKRGAGQPAAAVDEEAVILGDSPGLQRARDLIGRAAPTGASVLVLGPPGSGKSLAARVLHARSRRPGPLVRLDARDLTAETAAGALRQAAAEAAGGTLVLDEAGALPGPGQAALLALLEGGLEARIVSTAREAPELREELLARLNTVEVRMPPLRERGDDVVLLAEHFVRLFSRRYGKAPKPLDASALEVLKAQPPAGDVRGLRQAAERAVVLSEGDVLSAADLAAAPAQGAAAGGGAPDLNLSRSEKAIVEAALKRHAHNVSHAARELGLTRAALYRRMVKHGL